jgi:hypothetical protein
MSPVDECEFVRTIWAARGSVDISVEMVLGIRRVGVRSAKLASGGPDRFVAAELRGVDRLSAKAVKCGGRRGIGS